MSPNLKNIVGGCEIDDSIIQLKEINNIIVNNYPFGVIVLDNVFDSEEVFNICNLFDSTNVKMPVSIQGRTDIVDNRVGSIRTISWCENISKQLSNKIIKYLPNIRCNNYYPTDFWQNGIDYHWKPIGVSPMFRFMRYGKDGQHYAHYDSAYIYPNENKRTLLSMVIYLTDHNVEDGGCTRIINDNQGNIKIWNRNHDDWIRETQDNEVLLSIKPTMGSILLFPHRLCHDVQKYVGKGNRIIIRGDIIYEAI